jgi:hypothetical protein
MYLQVKCNYIRLIDLCNVPLQRGFIVAENTFPVANGLKGKARPNIEIVGSNLP